MNFLPDVLILFLIELAEAALLKAQTFKETIRFFHLIYHTQKLKFVLMHSSLLYVLYFIYTHGADLALLDLAAGLKILDFALKLQFIFKLGTASKAAQINAMQDVQITPAIKYAGAAVYPLLMLAALS